MLHYFTLKKYPSSVLNYMQFSVSASVVMNFNNHHGDHNHHYFYCFLHMIDYNYVLSMHSFFFFFLQQQFSKKGRSLPCEYFVVVVFLLQIQSLVIKINILLYIINEIVYVLHLLLNFSQQKPKAVNFQTEMIFKACNTCQLVAVVLI